MKILIADDHAVVRAGIRSFLETLPEIKEIDEARNGKEALTKIRRTQYDLVILDISMPDISGLDILHQLNGKKMRTRVLIISFMPEEVFAIKAFNLGASGYLLKGAPYEEMKKAVRRVLDGGKYVSDDLAESIVFANNQNQLLHEKLSDREFQIFLMLARGKKVKDIAETIFVSDKTVSTHRSRIMRKMNMSSNSELTIYAIDLKLLT